MNDVIETKVVDGKVVASMDYARSLVIATDNQCRMAIEYEQGLSALIKEIDATFDPHIKKAHETHKGLVAEKKKHSDPVEEAKRLIKGKRIVYADEQERIRKAEEARIQAEARRLAEEAALAAAIVAEKAGDSAEAEEIINEPIHVPVVTVAKTTPNAGVSGAIREIWSAEVDLFTLVHSIVGVKEIADRLLTHPYITIEANKSVLDGIARKQHENMKIAGVKAVSRKV